MAVAAQYNPAPRVVQQELDGPLLTDKQEACASTLQANPASVIVSGIMRAADQEPYQSHHRYISKVARVFCSFLCDLCCQ